MPNAYTVTEIHEYFASEPGKIWGEMPLEVQSSALAYAIAQQLGSYYLIVPISRTDELAALIEGQSNQVGAVMLISGAKVVPLDLLTDPPTFGYAFNFLSSLEILLVNDSDFPVSDV